MTKNARKSHNFDFGPPKMSKLQTPQNVEKAQFNFSEILVATCILNFSVETQFSYEKIDF